MTATANITINNTNDAPVATNDQYVVDEGTSVGYSAGLGVLGNDADADGDMLTATLLNGPSNGTLMLNSDGSFTYTHNGSETTGDSFTYTVSDGNGGTDTATVNLTINPVNDLPVATGYSQAAAEDTVVPVSYTHLTLPTIYSV